MPCWLGAGLWLATVTTVAMIALTAAACGWVCGYAHRSLIAWGRTRNPLRLLARAYRETWRDILAYGERLRDIMSAAQREGGPATVRKPAAFTSPPS